MNVSNGVYFHFFVFLESKIEQELIALNKWKFKITNDFVDKNELSLSILLMISNGMILKVVCTEKFPQERPRVFCLNSFAGDNMDPKTKEIDSSQIYYWLNNKKVIKLVGEIESFYEKNPPVRDLRSEEMLERMVKVETLIEYSDEQEMADELRIVKRRKATGALDEVESRMTEIKREMKAVVDLVEKECGGLTRRGHGQVQGGIAQGRCGQFVDRSAERRVPEGLVAQSGVGGCLRVCSTGSSTARRSCGRSRACWRRRRTTSRTHRTCSGPGAWPNSSSRN